MGKASCQGGRKTGINNCNPQRKTGKAERHPHRVRADKRAQYFSTICFVLYFKGAVKCIYTKLLSLQGKQVALEVLKVASAEQQFSEPGF